MVITMNGNMRTTGTSQRGMMPHVTYLQLCAVFGKPNSQGDGYKVDAEWIGMIEIGEEIKVFTIYNYKTGRNYLKEEGQRLLDITDWNIGGHEDAVVDLVTKYFDQECGQLIMR